MAKCRIQNLKPPCGYRLDGITDIRLLDLDDFAGFVFRGDDVYPNCYVAALLRRGDYADFETPDTAKYSSTLQNGEYVHTVETFISDLSAELSEQLHLATKRRYIVTFKGANGRYFVFGYDAGAALTYVNQTAEGLGSLVTITARSIYPLFEWNGAEITCEWGDFINIWQYVKPVAVCTWRDFVNIWEYIESCINDFGDDFGPDFTCESPGQRDVCTWQDFINIWKYLQTTCLNDFGSDFGPDFNCESPGQLDRCTWGGYINIWEYLQTTCLNDFGLDFSDDFNCYAGTTLRATWGDFINIWKEITEGCLNDFSDDFGPDFRCDLPTEPFLEVAPGTIWLQFEQENAEHSEVRSNTDWIVT